MPSGPAAGSAVPRVYFRTSTGKLVARARASRSVSLREIAQDVLDALSAGPTQAERRQGLGSLLPPQLGARVVAFGDGFVTVDLPAGVLQQGGSRGVVATAQLVMSLTSVAGVAAVRATRSGDPIELPVGDGSLTSRPVTAADFSSLLSTTSG